MKDLSKPEQGLKLNWTVSKAGTNRNVIPAEATAQADARALKVSDFDELEKALQDKIKNRLLPESKVALKFEVRRPPLEANDASRRVAAYGKTIYGEIGLPLKVDEKRPAAAPTPPLPRSRPGARWWKAWACRASARTPTMPNM